MRRCQSFFVDDGIGRADIDARRTVGIALAHVANLGNTEGVVLAQRRLGLAVQLIRLTGIEDGVGRTFIDACCTVDAIISDYDHLRYLSVI
jgi:hypothetical protein